jgi:uncharacterized protein YprB with RNaseH-like and TPR domain
MENGTTPVTEAGNAYLDIETAFDGRITIIGILRDGRELVQLVGKDATPEAVLAYLEGCSCLHTYNGHRFDLPVIKSRIGLDLRARFNCRDLMLDCWRHGLYGGFKGVEKKLGIARSTTGVDGMMAMQLWAKYTDSFDRESLDLLLRYNREDVENLAVLREILDRFPYGD